jgi:hypothetical protein
LNVALCAAVSRARPSLLVHPQASMRKSQPGKPSVRQEATLFMLTTPSAAPVALISGEPDMPGTTMSSGLMTSGPP